MGAMPSRLERAGLTCNKNSIPFDPEKPAVTSGVRLGTSAGTTRGFGETEFRRVGEMILTVIDALAKAGPEANRAVEERFWPKYATSAAAYRFIASGANLTFGVAAEQ